MEWILKLLKGDTGIVSDTEINRYFPPDASGTTEQKIDVFANNNGLDYWIDPVFFEYNFKKKSDGKQR